MRYQNSKKGRIGAIVARDNDFRLPAHHFFINSFSALSDFVKFRPDSVKSVSCRPHLADKVRSLLHQHQLPESLLSVTEPAESKAPQSQALEAIVKVEATDEATLFNRMAGRSGDLIIVLDHIMDPRNLGAIVRSAAFFGVRDLIIAKDRQVSITAAAVATSQAGFAVTNITEVVNLGRVLDELKSSGYWVLGADMEGEAIENLAGVYEKNVLVMGSEDKGLAAQIRKRCDRMVKITGYSGFDSLNVSVACGICLHELTKGTKPGQQG